MFEWIHSKIIHHALRKKVFSVCLMVLPELYQLSIYINAIFCFTDQEYIELLTVWRKQGKKKNYENNDSVIWKPVINCGAWYI